MTIRPSADLAARTSSMRFDDLGAVAVERAKSVIADALACGMAGSVIADDIVRPMAAYAARLSSPGRCSVLATGAQVVPSVAAVVNATTIHTIDYDDTHMAVVAHFGASVVPAALAVVEDRGGTGAELVTAVAAGFEMGARVGRAVMPDHYQRWHSTASLGGIAAAAAAARAMGLDATATEVAVGFAADDAGGTRYCIKEGDFTKSLHAGTAAWKGTQAALLAEAGAAGPTGFLEHEVGFLWAYTDERDHGRLRAQAAAASDDDWEISNADIKAHPCILSSHTAIEGAASIASEQGLTLDGIARIVLRQPAYSDRHGLNYRPSSVMAARLSVPFCVVAGVEERGRVGLAQFTGRRFLDPEVQTHMDKVTIRPERELAARYPGSAPTVVEVHTTDGRCFTREVGYALGSHERPLDPGAFTAKQRELLAHRLDPAEIERWLATTSALEDLDDLGELGGLLRTAPPQPAATTPERTTR